jgi:ferredoxin
MNKNTNIIKTVSLIVVITVLFIIGYINRANADVKSYSVNTRGCIGCEQCLEICPVDAITLHSGKAVIDQEKCIECGICYDGNGDSYLGCPVGAIEEVQASQTSSINSNVEQSSQDVSNVAVIADSIYFVVPEGCISCGLCVTNCPLDAIEMINGKAVIDQEKCIECGICADGNGDFNGCPVNTIIYKAKE